MSPVERRRPRLIEDGGDRDGLAGSRTAHHPTRPPRQPKVARATCSEGHVIESVEILTECPAWLHGRPCEGVIQ